MKKLMIILLAIVTFLFVVPTVTTTSHSGGVFHSISTAGEGGGE